MRRRDFFTLLGTAVAWPRIVVAHPDAMANRAQRELQSRNDWVYSEWAEAASSIKLKIDQNIL